MVEKKPGRSRKIYVLWSIALGVQLLLGLFCWKVVVPLARIEAVLGKASACSMCYAYHDSEQIVQKLGGPDKAVPRIMLYLRTDRIAFWRKDTGIGVILLLADCGRQAVPALVSLAGDEDLGTRFGAAKALNKMGRAADGAVPALLELSADPDKQIRAYAAEALEKIRIAGGPPDWRPGVIDPKEKKLVAFWVKRAPKGKPAFRDPAVVKGDYGTFIVWNECERRFYIFDNPGKRYFATADFETFLLELAAIPNNANPERVDTCTVSRSWEMPAEAQQKLAAVLRLKRGTAPPEDENPNITCYCKSEGLQYLPLSGSP